MELKRLAVQSLHKDGLSQRKIAEKLGITLSVVNMLVHRNEAYTEQNTARGRKRKD